MHCGTAHKDQKCPFPNGNWKKKGGHYGWLEVTYQSGIEWVQPADSPMATCEKNARFRCVLGRPFL